MSWLQLFFAISVVTLILLVPGFLATWGAGLRGLWRWALIAPAGATVVALSSVVAGFFGGSWSILWVIVVGVALAAVLRVMRRFLWEKETSTSAPAQNSWPLLITTAAAVITVGVQLLIVMGDPQNISQTFDNIFHLNGIRYAVETGNASPLWLGTMTSASSGGVPFYPSLWHAIGSLTVQITGASIPVASNAVMVVFAAIVWPLSIMLLTRTLFGSKTSVLVSAAVLAASLPAFPLKMVDYGVLFPYMAGLAMVPAALAAVIMLTDGSLTRARRVMFAVVALGVVPGIAVAHPGAIVALLALATAVFAIALVRTLASRPGLRTTVLVCAGAVAYAVIAVGAWYVLRPPVEARTWGPTETVGQAFGEVVTSSLNGASVNVVATILVVIGVVATAKRRSRADVIALALLIVTAGLYIVVSGLQNLELRDTLVGAWYNNAPRLAAILPIAWVVIGARGGQAAWEWAAGKLADRRVTSRGIAVVATVATLVIVLIPQIQNIRPTLQWGVGMFAYSDVSPLLTSDERELLSRLDEHTNEDDVIAGSSWTGAGLAYALEDRRVLMTHTLMDMTPDIVLINEELDEATPGSPVCEAVAREGVTFVLDFGDQQINNENHPMPGFEQLATSSSVELVDEQGDVALYRVIGCGE